MFTIKTAQFIACAGTDPTREPLSKLLVYTDKIITSNGHVLACKYVQHGLTPCAVTLSNTSKETTVAKGNDETHVKVNGVDCDIVAPVIAESSINKILDDSKINYAFTITSPKKLKKLIKQYFNHRKVVVNGEEVNYPLHTIAFNFKTKMIEFYRHDGFSPIAPFDGIIEAHTDIFRAGFQAKYLSEVFNLEGTHLTVQMRTHDTSAFVKGSDASVKYLVMPMRLVQR